jgi:glycosyltransferase involved in cell wall biosynthesis
MSFRLRVLYVCSGNFKNNFEISQVFIHELITEQKELGVETEIFLISGKGYLGYLRALIKLWIKVTFKRYDLVHAFYGLSGLVACLQFITPVVITFLGSDVNNKRENRFSKIANRLGKYSVFVEKSMVDKIGAKGRFSVIPLGLDLAVFKPIDKLSAREITGFKATDTIFMFSSSFDNAVKNFPLAKRALELSGEKVVLIELGKKYTREELAVFYNASDVFLMTSFHEGSPQTIKEAMACNCPIVSTDVGDVRWLIGETNGCYISDYEPENVAANIRMALNFSEETGRTSGRERIMELGLDNGTVAKKILDIYKKVIEKTA